MWDMRSLPTIWFVPVALQMFNVSGSLCSLRSLAGTFIRWFSFFQVYYFIFVLMNFVDLLPVWFD